MITGTISGEISIAVMLRRAGMRGLERPTAASVPKLADPDLLSMAA
jgi:hypothetical protein